MDFYLGQGFGLLSDIYSIIDKFLFNYAIENAFNNGTYNAQIANVDLVATILSVTAVVFVFAIPFALVWRVIRALGGK